MKHPRFFALLLSTILLFSLFAGCADNPAATETSTSASEEKAPLTETDKTAPETAETLTAAKESLRQRRPLMRPMYRSAGKTAEK